MQKIINAQSAAWQNERAGLQMTLGELIAKLDSLPPESLIQGISEPHSYRGYYCDLAFEDSDSEITAKDLSQMCKTCLNEDFEGYKGGYFTMTKVTPIWIASYGETGIKIMSINNGKFTTSLDED